MPIHQNDLLLRLSEPDRTRLLARCELVPLLPGSVLLEPDTEIKFIYLPVDGFVSVTKTLPGHPSHEVGMVGCEGMLGATLALGPSQSPLQALVQGPGSAWRMSARAFRSELAQSASLKKLTYRYIYVLMSQLAASVACTRFHKIGPRLARWLLMSQDRARSSKFHVTHEQIAQMLGVRRVSVTTAAAEFQSQGLIRYSRGGIEILDRRNLLACACSCYAANQHIYDEILHA